MRSSSNKVLAKWSLAGRLIHCKELSESWFQAAVTEFQFHPVKYYTIKCIGITKRYLLTQRAYIEIIAGQLERCTMRNEFNLLKPLQGLNSNCEACKQVLGIISHFGCPTSPRLIISLTAMGHCYCKQMDFISLVDTLWVNQFAGYKLCKYLRLIIRNSHGSPAWISWVVLLGQPLELDNFQAIKHTCTRANFVITRSTRLGVNIEDE